MPIIPRALRLHPPHRASRPAILAGVLAAAITATAAAAQIPQDKTFVPGLRVGEVRIDSTPASLRRAYGPENVILRRLPAGEGTTLPGAILFRGTAAEMKVFWHPGRTRVAYVEIGPQGRAWRSPFGIRIGLTVARVQQLNGRPFQIERENDGHNCNSDWDPDKLSKRMVLCFATDEPLSHADETRISRSRGPRSALPVVQRTFRIHTMRIHLGRAIPPGPGTRRRSGETAERRRATLSPAQSRCRRFGQLRSAHSTEPVTLMFINRSGAYRTIAWLDGRGRPRTYANLNAGQRFSVTTYLGHPWMITDGPGNCLAIHMPRRGQRVIVLRPDRRRFGRE